jgi:chorismate mutase
MPAVAQAKEQRGLPTEDAAQEAQVIARARERAALVGAARTRSRRSSTR